MDTMLLKIKDIPGTSGMLGYENQIEILSYSHGIAMQVDGGVRGTERITGRPQFQDFTITKHMDRSTPLLNQKCCEGANLGEVQLTVGRNDAGTVIPFIVYTLSNVVISMVGGAGVGDDKPMENLALNFTAIQWVFTASGESGHDRTSGGWDVVANTRK
jgi:type VI secretion system secreted protein Hcp